MNILKFNDTTKKLKVFDLEAKRLRKDLKDHSDMRKLQLAEAEYSLHPVTKALNRFSNKIDPDNKSLVTFGMMMMMMTIR